MELAEHEAMLSDIETRVDRLRALYEQWFQGLERLEPQIPRKEVERRMQLLRKEPVRNTALRFRFQTLTQKWTSYLTYWGRVARQIEEGTYRRDVLKARQQREDARARRSQPPAPIDIDVEIDDESADLDVASALEEAMRSIEQPTPGAPSTRPSARPLSPFGARRPSMVPPAAPIVPGAARPAAPGAAAAQPTSARTFSAPKPSLVAQPVANVQPARPITPAALPGPQPQASTKPAGTAGTPSSGTVVKPAPAPGVTPPRSGTVVKPALEKGPVATPPKPAGTQAPQLLPGAAPKPAPAVVRPGAAPAPVRAAAPTAATPTAVVPSPQAARAPAPAPRAAPAPAAKRPDRTDLDEAHVRRVYDAYVDARRKNNERVDNLTLEGVAKNLRDMAPKFRQKFGGAVDFDVVVKDGKVGLKPKPMR